MENEITAEEFLNELFEFHYCEECHRDKEYHTVLSFFGNWFAQCNED